MAYNLKDLLAGLLFLALGVLFVALTLIDLPLGTALRMGPGYFPILLASLLIILGAINVTAAFSNTVEDETPTHPIPWRGMFFVLAAPLVFSASVRNLGFAAAVFLVALFASMATSRMTVLQRSILVLVITIFCLIVFYWGLGLPVQLVSPRLGIW